MTTTAMKITADWPRKREMPLVFELYDRARPRNSAGEIDSWPDELLASTEEPMRHVCPTSTMIFRTDDGGPRKIHAACTYGVSVGPQSVAMTVIASRWAICPDMSPSQQKLMAQAVFISMDEKINTGGSVVTVVSEYDLWRQILLRFCGFQWIKTIDVHHNSGPAATMYRFVRVKR